MTVAEARYEFLQRKKDISDTDNIAGTLLKWMNYVNRYAYREMTNILPESFITEQVYTLVVDQQAYDLPDDFQDIIPQGTGMYLLNDDGSPTSRRLPPSSFGSTRPGVYLNLTSLVVTPKPPSVKSYVLRYIPLLPDLVEDDDEFVIPTRFSMHIMDGLDSCYNIWDEDQNAEIFNDERFIRTMEEFVSLIKPDTQTYLLPDSSQNYY